MPSKILIVDDEPHMLRVTELSLKKGGFEILMARNGREAIETVQREKPVLVVMDVSMPEMDGLTALKHLKQMEDLKHIPVIMLTARGHTMTRQQAEESGAVMFLTKPFSPSQLLVESKRIIEGAPKPPS
jgi:CheY-like chemotaxis protein